MRASGAEQVHMDELAVAAGVGETVLRAAGLSATVASSLSQGFVSLVRHLQKLGKVDLVQGHATHSHSGRFNS